MGVDRLIMELIILRLTTIANAMASFLIEFTSFLFNLFFLTAASFV
jgi:hypothetical protein